MENRKGKEKEDKEQEVWLNYLLDQSHNGMTADNDTYH